MKLRAALLSVPLLGLALTSALAWDPLGHMLVTQVASAGLTPAARAEIDAAIARFNDRQKPDAPYDFVVASCWMDDARASTKEFNEWHYVNLPFTRDGQPIPEGSRAAPHVAWGIAYCEALITGRKNDPTIDRDQAIVMLLHLVGDVHQPLHATSRNDDLGGNRVRVANLKDPLVDLIFTRGGNLHFFWDSAYRRVYRDGSATVLYEAPLYAREKPVEGHNAARAIVEREAAALMKKYPPAVFSSQGDGPAWALESHVLGFDLAYGKLPPARENEPVRLTGPYVDEARVTAEKRVVLAGYRLANLLNHLLDPAKNAAPQASPPATPGS